MTDKEIEEGNRLIIEFVFPFESTNDTAYHSNWQALMHAIHRLKQAHAMIDTQTAYFVEQHLMLFDLTIFSSIETVFQAVVECIKFLKLNKHAVISGKIEGEKKNYNTLAKITGNDPAYPVKDIDFDANRGGVAFSKDSASFSVNYSGLTIHQYFTAIALQGILFKMDGVLTNDRVEIAVSEAIMCADVIIKTLNK